MANPVTVKPELTIVEMVKIRDALAHVRDDQKYLVSRDDFTGYQTDDIALYNVEAGEKALALRQEMADLIYKLTGEILTEELSHVAKVGEARRQWTAEEANRQAAALEEV